MTSAVRVATVSFNPAIDQTVFVPGFAAGTVNRVTDVREDAGGKGVNVAAFLAQSGFPVIATGLLGERNAEPFARLFAQMGICDHFVRIPRATRTNIKIVDDVGNRVTELKFPGLRPSARHLVELDHLLDAFAGTVECFVLSGSLPVGVADDVYAVLVARLKRRGCAVVLDASGPALAAAVHPAPELERPDILKPKLAELRELTGERLETDDAVVRAARRLVGRGIGLVAVSMGARGAIFVESGAAVIAVPPSIRVASTVGAGDAMVAGLVAGRLRGLGLAEQARLASALAVAALARIGPRLPPPDAIEGVMQQIDVRPIA